MRHHLALVLLIAVVATGCRTQISPPPSSPPPSPTPVGSAGGELALRRTPANLGCDAIGVTYRSLTFHIDPDAAEPVSAVTNLGAGLLVYWSPGFVGDASLRVVRDAAGAVVAADGDVLPIPDGQWPRLHGYFVCPSPTAIYVLERDPA